MKKSIALFIGLLLALSVTAPALAYTGITGQVIDSKTSAPWQWGGDVYVRNLLTNTIIATCTLDPSGQIVESVGNPCLYTSSVFGSPTGVLPAPNDPLGVVFDFHCTASGNCSGGPSGTPSPTLVFYPEAVGALYPILLPIETGTGPNAVQLTGMKGRSSLGIGLVMAMVAGATLLVKSKVNTKPESTYSVPEVTYEGVLEVQAGSPLGDTSDGILPDELL